MMTFSAVYRAFHMMSEMPAEGQQHSCSDRRRGPPGRGSPPACPPGETFWPPRGEAEGSSAGSSCTLPLPGVAAAFPAVPTRCCCSLQEAASHQPASARASHPVCGPSSPATPPKTLPAHSLAAWEQQWLQHRVQS